MSEALQLTSQCNRSAVPVLNQPQLIYILTELVPGQVASGVHLPLNFALVLDRSGSMAGEKLRTMKEAVKNIVDQLDPGDIISIVTFDNKHQLLLPAQPAQDKVAIKQQVDKIRDGGSTVMAPALHLGLEQVRQTLDAQRISRIVLLTDGETNDPEEDSFQEAVMAGEIGVPIIGLGFGERWNEEFLIALADRSVRAEPGSHTGYTDYIPTPEKARQIFQEVYQSMQVVAQDVTLTIRMVQGMEARRVWRLTPAIQDIGRGAIQGRAIVAPVGQLEKGGVAYLAEVLLPPRPAGQVRIAQTDITFTLPGGGPQRQAADLILQFTNDPTLLNNPPNGHVMNIVEKVQAFKLQTQALSEAESGNVRGATQKLRQAVTILLSQGEAELANQMAQEASRLEQSGELSNEAKKTIKLTSRKTVRIS